MARFVMTFVLCVFVLHCAMTPGVISAPDPLRSPRECLNVPPTDLDRLLSIFRTAPTDPIPTPSLGWQEAQQTSDHSWTILFYDDADFNNGWDAFDTVAREFFSTNQTDVLLLQDSFEGPSSLYHIAGQGNYTVLEQWGEVDMGDAANLELFLSYAKLHYPARRYMLCMYDHGAHFYGTCVDENNSTGETTMLTWADKRNALAAVGGVDVLAFTAPCVTTPLEGMVELDETVDVLVGSEDLSFYAIWLGVMDDVCSLLATDENVTTEEVAARMVLWAGANEWFGADQTADAIDPEGAPAIASALDRLACYLAINMEYLHESLVQVRTDCWELGNWFLDDYYGIDLVSWLETLAAALPEDPVVQARVDAVIAAHDSAVIAVANGANQGEAHGISIYYPELDEPRVAIYTGYGLDFVADTRWDEFLLSYFSGEPLQANVTDISCLPEPGGIRLEWKMEYAHAGDEFVVFRQEEGEGDYVALDLTCAGFEDDWTCLDTSVSPGGSYRYRVKSAGGAVLFETDWVTATVATTRLLLNRPNPFSQDTTIPFELAKAGEVELTILDLAGRLVRTVVADQRFECGPQSCSWDGCDDGGRSVAPGVYVACLRVGDTLQRMRMILVR